MEIYDQVALGGQLLILLKSILLIIFLFLLGHFLFPKKSNNLFLLVANGVAVALIFTSAVFASIYTLGHSVLVPLVFLGVIVSAISLKAGNFRQINLKRVFNLQAAFLLLVFILLFVVNSLSTQPFNEQNITIVNSDISLYSNWSRHLMNSGTEALPQELLNAKSMQSFYHFIDLWFVGWGATAFNVNIYIFYSLVYKPVLQFTLIAFIIGFAKRFNFPKSLQALSVFIVFTTAIYPFLYSSKAPWYLDLSAKSYPIYHYIGTYFVIVYFFIVLSAFLFYRRKDVAIVLISMLGLINPLFVPVVPLFFLGVLAIYFLQKKVKLLSHANIIGEDAKRAYFLALAVSVLLAIFFKIFIIGNESSGTVDILRLKTYLVALNVLARTAFVSLVYFPICVAGYAFLIKYNRSYRNVALFFLYLFLSGIAFMSLVFENIQGNIGQILNILWNFPLIILGCFGFLLMIYKSKRYKTVFTSLFLINSLWSVYNTFSEKNSTFHPVYRFNHTSERIEYRDIDTLSEIVKNYGNRGGYFLNAGEDTRNLNVTDFVTYNVFTKSYSNSYRLNAVTFDQYHKEANKVYKNTILYSLNEDPNVENKTLAIVEKMDVHWLVVDNNHYFLPEDLKSLFVKEYKLNGFSIFVRPQ